MKKVIWIRRFALLAAMFLVGSQAYAVDVSAHPELTLIVDELVLEHGIDRDLLNSWLQDATIDQTILQIMKRPAERLPWHKYRSRFLNRNSIQQGKKYLVKHFDSFIRAEREFGVPSEVVAAIIGVETRYGAVTGRRRVLDSLVTLSLEYPRRSKFFLTQLKEFLTLSHSGTVNPLETKGSYAGAIGIPQFMPTSYQHYAIDFDGDGYINLVDSSVDAIGSVAHYLKHHGWRVKEPIVKRLSDSEGERIRDYATGSFTVDVPVMALVEEGIPHLRDRFQGDKVGIVRLKYDGHDTFRVAYPNFFVLTRYNRSHNYAMTVFELAEKIQND